MMLFLIGFSLLSVAQAYQVLHIKSPNGNQNFTWEQANEECQKRNMKLATWKQMQTAFQEGLDVCQCGWLINKASVKPVQEPRQGCGTKRRLEVCSRAHQAVSAIFGQSNAAYDAFCHSPEGDSPEMSTEICDIDPGITLKCRKNKRLLLILEVKRYMTQPCGGEESNTEDYFMFVAGQCSLKKECFLTMSHLRLQDSSAEKQCTCASIRYRCIEELPLLDICPDVRTVQTLSTGYLTGPKYPQPMPDILNIMQCNCTIKSDGQVQFLLHDIALHRNFVTKTCQQNLAMLAPSGVPYMNAGIMTCRNNSYQERTFVAAVTPGTRIMFWNRPEDMDYGEGGEVSYGDYDHELTSGGRFLMKYKGGRDFKLVCEKIMGEAPLIVNPTTFKPTIITTVTAVPQQDNQLGAIIGGAVGGVLVIIVIIVIVIVVIRLRKRKTQKASPKHPSRGVGNNGQIANPSYNAIIVGNDSNDAHNHQNPQAESGYIYVDETDLNRDKVEYYSTPDLADGQIEETIYVNDDIGATDCDRSSYEALNPKNIESEQTNIYEGFDEPKKKVGSSKASGKSNTSGRSYAQYDDVAHQDRIEEENIYDVCTPRAEREEDVYDTVQD